MRASTKRAALALSVGLIVAGCSAARSAIGGAVNGAAGAAGNQAGQRMAGGAGGGGAPGSAGAASMPGGQYGAQAMVYYANFMFGMAFHSGGYWIGTGSGQEQPGQWTLWEYTANGHQSRMERAFLTKLADGKEWWRVQYYTMDNSRDTVAFEAMFNADRTQVLRMRGKSPGQQAGEVPVEQGTGFTWTQPTQLTQESLQGATVGNESVTTPAGTFQTTHLRYNMMGGGTYEWWTASNVPGGVVKYTAGYGSDTYTVTLVGMGTGARSILGSY